MTQQPTITTVEQLREIVPYNPMLTWLAENNITDLADAWDRCPRADWMLWLCNALDLLDDRARRMIACKCVRETPLGDGRKVWDLLADENRRAVAVSERYADGTATDEELAAAYVAARAAETAATAAVRAAAARADAARAAQAAAMAVARVSRADAADAAQAAQADIVREIVGNPFRDSATETIAVELTRDEYDVLVDALRSATARGEDETSQRLRRKLLEAWLAASVFDPDV